MASDKLEQELNSLRATQAAEAETLREKIAAKELQSRKAAESLAKANEEIETLKAQVIARGTKLAEVEIRDKKLKGLLAKSREQLKKAKLEKEGPPPGFSPSHVVSRVQVGDVTWCLVERSGDIGEWVAEARVLG